MTGFVDPFFKSINPLEPNFLICSLDSSIPSLNVKPLKKGSFWTFHDENPCIVYSASRVRNLKETFFNAAPPKIEIHIHLWLGCNVSKFCADGAIARLAELDDMLEGAAVLHREVQGHESHRFLSYFKSSGLVIRKGMLNSVFISLEPIPTFLLYELSERSSTLILTELNRKEEHPVYVLQQGRKIFISIQSQASTEDLYSALKFAEAAERNWAADKIVWIFTDPSKRFDTPEEDVEDFYRIWNSIPYQKTAVSEDLVLSRTNSRGNVKLYKVRVNEGDSKVVHVKNSPLIQSDLSGMDACIIDHYMNGIWIWLSRKFPREKRERAIYLAMSYLTKNTQSNTPGGREASIARVIEGREPAEFKLLFNSWVDNSVGDGEYYFSKKVLHAVNANLSTTQLQAYPFLAASTQLLDYGTGKMTIVRVNESKLEPLQHNEFGIFNSNFSYLVHYCYTDDGVAKEILYYWLGSKAPKREKESSIWSSLRHIPEYKNVRVRVRLQQHFETPHFYAIFQGKMIILNAAPISSNKSNHLDEYDVVLLRVNGDRESNAYSIQVEPRAYSLSTFNVYILRTPTKGYVWSGLLSRCDEREMAKKIANRWSPNYEVLLEGQESNVFLLLLSSSQLYPSKPQLYSSEERASTTNVNVPPRLYKCGLTKDNKLRVMEVANFAQSDLGCGDTILLDAWNIIFVWSGSEVQEEDKLKNELIAQIYLTLDPGFRNLGLPIIQVEQDHEPPAFTGFFPSWNKTCTVYNEKLKRKLLATIADKSVGAKQEQSYGEKKVGVSPKPPSDKSPEFTTTAETCPVDSMGPKAEDELQPGVDPNPKEDYLTDEDFGNVFGMSRAMFKKLPPWKQKNLKIAAKLF